jgi:hypothetical protein
MQNLFFRKRLVSTLEPIKPENAWFQAFAFKCNLYRYAEVRVKAAREKAYQAERKKRGVKGTAWGDSEDGASSDEDGVVVRGSLADLDDPDYRRWGWGTFHPRYFAVETPIDDSRY